MIDQSHEAEPKPNAVLALIARLEGQPTADDLRQAIDYLWRYAKLLEIEETICYAVPE